MMVRSIGAMVLAMVIAMAMVFTSVGFAADSKAKAIESTKAPSYLFVLQAEKGSLKSTGKDGLFNLTLKHTDVKHVIEFSDRPYRIVKYISATDLKKGWPQGKNSFKADPPNAVLMAKGMKAQIIVLEGITVDNQTVSFDINLTNPTIGLLKNGRLEKIVVVVDASFCPDLRSFPCAELSAFANWLFSL